MAVIENLITIITKNIYKPTHGNAVQLGLEDMRGD